MVQFEQKAGVSKVFLALGIGFVYFFLIFLNYGGQILSNMVGFIFPGIPLFEHFAENPAYESIRAIESAGSADDTQWLTYWVVFSFFNVVEYWSRTILYWLRKTSSLGKTLLISMDSILLPFQDDHCPLARSSPVPWRAIHLPRLPPTCLGTPYRPPARRTRYFFHVRMSLTSSCPPPQQLDTLQEREDPEMMMKRRR